MTTTFDGKEESFQRLSLLFGFHTRVRMVSVMVIDDELSIGIVILIIRC